MNILYLLVPLALGLATLMLVGFLWAAKQGQYDDLETPRQRMLLGGVDEMNERRKK
jgi:cbb3-type cytochrome oxidase maturation protein